MISKVIFGATLLVEIGFLWSDKYLAAVISLFCGIALAAMLDEDMWDDIGSHRPRASKKPYYKDEFEQYQHYKHCKRK